MSADLSADRASLEAVSSVNSPSPSGTRSPAPPPLSSRLLRHLSGLLEQLSRLGQLTLLRAALAAHLAAEAAFESRQLAAAVRALNE